MVKARKKLSKSAWILLAIIGIGIVAVAVLAIIGYVDLTFAADGLTGLSTWMSESPINTSIVLGVSFAAGMGVFYWLKSYIIGEEQVMMGYTNTGTGGYNPAPSTPSTPQQNSDVEIS